MIHILWATIRPQLFNQMYKLWLERSSNKDIITHVAVNSEADANIVKQVLGKNDEVIIVTSDRKGVCYPSYMLSSKLEANKEDIVVFASDDFEPIQNWDVYLENKLKNREGLLFVRDGYQLPDSSNMLTPVITIPIMTFGCLEKLNKVIYHPAYYHMHSDGELYLNVKELGLLIDERMTDTTEFTHHHWAAGKRNPDQNDHNYNNKWSEDDNTWKMRKNMTVEERLKVIL
jgi:hypothetical protein